ncbi:glycoside hydrolase family 172 protein [Pedobacter ginsengisoli]|nr:glycoside hydrolase family 172 protein [Pedobacter ginsengisoli]
MQKFITGIWIVLLTAGGFIGRAQTVTMASLLKEMTDFNAVTYWPKPYYSAGQASSYDRHSISPDKPGWFANGDKSEFIKVEEINGHKEYVMLDEKGPGALVRFWLTTFKRAGKLRVYFDNNPEPEIVIPSYDLTKIDLKPGPALLIPHSSYEPLEKGGSTLYLPMPYAKHCKVTWEDAANEITEPRYYQINFRKYIPNTTVRTFTLKEARSLSGLIDNVNKQLLNPINVTKGKQSLINQTILPKQTASVNLPKGANAVKFLSIEVSSENKDNLEKLLRSTILKISFDGQQSVECPVGDFSGSGVGGKPLQSWYRTVTANGEIISRWTMPYQKTASISLENQGDQSVSIKVKAVSQLYSWNSNSMYFNAHWKFTEKVPIKKWDETDGAIEWELNRIKGKGIFLGDSFAVFNHMHTWYGEGDQKLYVDCETFPSEFGTGAEDYYNTSWAPVVLYQSPFANAPRADAEDSYGHNTFTRTRNLDGVTFKTDFKYDLEMLGWANGTADCAATTYWYGFR